MTNKKPKAKDTVQKVAQADQNTASFDLPKLPSILTQPLGLEGWTAYEPVLLAALASEDPLLLIGPHGSAKSFLLERLAQTLNLEYRFYNASLINYDDLVGIPIPDEERKSLKYISTPSAVWDAEVVFLDEINRTRPELQNKLFPIVHERRVQGIRLEKLRYRWAAMNPPPSAEGDDDPLDVYLGAEPLDPALADRFSFLIEVPGWQKLTEDEKRRIFRDQFRGEHPFPIPPTELVSLARQFLYDFRNEPPLSLEDYLLALLAQLENDKINLSARRATMLHQNILAVHAARMAIFKVTYPELPPQVIDWGTSALLALQNSLPQIAQGRKPEPSLLLAAHRHAWEISRLDAENPWRVLLKVNDPLERCVKAIHMGDQIDDNYLSQLILDAVANQAEVGRRAAVALPIYLAVHKKRNLQATAYESLSITIQRILKSGEFNHPPDDCPRPTYRKVKDLCANLEKGIKGSDGFRNRYAINLLQGLLPDGYSEISPGKVFLPLKRHGIG